MAQSPCSTFHPPAEWPDAKTEEALDAAQRALGSMLETLENDFPSLRSEGAVLSLRTALEHITRGKKCLSLAYQIEMEARLELWRGLGYPQ